MGSSRNSALDDVIERQIRESSDEGDRFVEMRLDIEHEDRPGEILLSVGCKWDRRIGEYVLEAEHGPVVRIHDGQAKAVEWFSSWLGAHADRRDHPPQLSLAELEAEELDVDPDHAYSALFAGGRRGGKTFLAVTLAAVYAIAFPGSIVWIVSPSDQKHDEVRRYAAGVLAASWLERETAEGWELANGSQILLKSAYLADGLKEGKANFVILNEGQMMTKRAYTVARGAIVDASGLVLVCANPPVEKKDQVWVSDFAADAAAGRRASVFIEFNPLLNPHIDRRALLSMAPELDERTFAIEVLGQFRGPADAVAYNWIRLENERKVSRIERDLGNGKTAVEWRARLPVLGRPGEFVELVEVTAQALAIFEEGVGIEDLLGLDVQRFPHIGGPVYKLFVPRDADGKTPTPTRDNVIAWIVGEVVLPGGDEVDYCTAARAGGYMPSSSMIVCDASGRYQHSRRKAIDQPPPDWKGRGSFDIIRGQGYRRIVPPMRRMKANPAIVDRARAFTSMICSGVGVRRLYADPDRAPKTCKSIRDWRTKHGQPSRTEEAAHLGDAASYPMVRLFPRILRSTKPGQVDPVAERVDNAANPAASAPLRILPRSSGPSRSSRRGSRVRGL